MSVTHSPALPGSDTVLPAAECAATLAHLAVLHAATNGVRFHPHMRRAPGGAPQARVSMQLGAQDALVSADTARLVLETLDAEPRADVCLRLVSAQLLVAIADAEQLARLAAALAARS